MPVKCTERYSPTAENPTRERSQADGRAALDRGTYGGSGHRSTRRRLESAFEVDTLEKPRKADRQPTWAERVHADPCTSLMGLEPMALALRIAGRR